MPQVRDIAHVTMPGIRDGKTIEEQARLLWESVHAACVRGKVQHWNGTHGRGYKYQGSLQRHVLALWPEQATASSEKLSEFSRPIYEYLRATQNAYCEAPTARPPVWWISDTYTGAVSPERTPNPREVEQQRREDKLTATEAGDDREPAPVIMIRRAKTQVTTTAEVPEAVLTAFETQRNKNAEEHAALLELITEFLGGSKQPLVPNEVAHVFSIATSSARDALNKLVAQGRLHCRPETKEERYLRAGGSLRATRAMMYSVANPVPQRTVREAVEGFLQAPTPDIRPMPRQEVKDRISIALRSYVRHGTFTPQEIADKAGVAVGTVRTYLRDYLAQGILASRKNPGSNRRLVYRVPKEAEDTVRAMGYEASTRVKPRLMEPRDVAAAAERPPVPAFVPVNDVPTVDAPEGPNIDVLLAQLRDFVTQPPVPVADPALTAEIARLRVEVEDLKERLRRSQSALRVMTDGG